MTTETHDVVIVGAGFSGVLALHRMRALGLDALVIEAADGVGGTWYWNRYPGARCDIESMEYSYQFSEELQQEWEWSERYATQPEILRYINAVTDRFQLRDGIRFNTRVTAARFDSDNERWSVSTDDGTQVSAQYFIMATGCLSSANMPDIDGIDDFAGESYHTGHWPHEPVDFSGKKVAVIGTGSSGIQCIPLIAKQAEQLTVFQRTPNYSIPAYNQPLDPEQVASVKERYAEFREENRHTSFHADFGYGELNAVDVSAEEREAEFEARWQRGGLPFLAGFADLLFDKEANEMAAEFLRGKIAGIVEDPEVAEKLMPDGIVGCKRLCVDTDYYKTYNKEHVSLVDIRDTPIECITEHGVKTSDAQFDVDCIVFATGFDAMTGAILKVDIQGIDGQRLQDAWAEGPKSYLGLAVSGFPNMFTVTGPGSPSVLTNMLGSIEHHVEWIADCITYVKERGAQSVQATAPAQESWVTLVNDIANATVYYGCNSWYLGANIPGKPRVFMPYLGFDTYYDQCNQVVANNYEGFSLGA